MNMNMNIWRNICCCCCSSFKYQRPLFNCTTYIAFYPSLLRFRSFTTYQHYQLQLKDNDINTSLYKNKPLRITHLVSSKSTPNKNQLGHLQLIQDLLQTYSSNLSEETPSCHHHSIVPYSNFNGSNINDSKPHTVTSHQLLPSFSDDALSGVVELHREGSRIDVSLLLYALRVCGVRGNLNFGTQLQCLAVRENHFTNVYVATSLISMYSKCGQLRSASMVFEEMGVRNVVSWTALISGFAQNHQVHDCLELYRQMRHSAIKPNDFTLTSLLSACVGNGSLGQGKIAHCLVILSGFHSYVQVGNALVSMYCKCGDLADGFSVFQAMHDKDIVSWNSMIAGYALHGLAWKAIDLFEEMRKQKIKPDKITFLGVLSSCCHAGLVKEGHIYFNSMAIYGVEPDLGHYSCIVDLLGRAGLVEEGRNFILEMPMKPNSVIWGSLLSSCRLHNNVWIGIEAAENRLALEPSCAATHVQLAKLYARVGKWEHVAKLWKMVKDTELKTSSGYSWISIGTEVFSFRADDTSNFRMNEILSLLEGLKDHMTSDHVPESYEEFDFCSWTIVSCEITKQC